VTRLGIGTYAYAWSIGVPGHPQPSAPMDHTAFLHRSADLGVTLVQYADNLPLDTLSPAAFDALLAEAARLGMSIEVGTRGIAHDHLRRYLEIARRCGSPIVRVVVDTKDHHPTPAEVVEIVRGILPEFEAAGVTLAIENHDRFKAAALADVVRTLDSTHVGICLDTVNSFGALEGPDVVVAALGPYVVNLHVKEFTVHRVSHNMGFVVEGVPAGQGMLDVPWLLAQLQGRYGRAFNAIVELWPAPEATADATAAKEDAWVAASVGYLKTVIV
jgi:sugar phosphate isomerase/epimerase